MILETIPSNEYPRVLNPKAIWKLNTDGDHEDISIVFMEDGTAWVDGWGTQDQDIRTSLIEILLSGYL